MSDAKPTWSDFGQHQRIAFSLAGTVAIPSPFPACGKISVGAFVPPEKPVEGYKPEYYLKIVEVVQERHIVTRLVRLRDVRAVRVRTKKQDGTSEWTLMTEGELAPLIEAKKEALKQCLSAGGPLETPLFADDAIVHVPESASVLLRQDHAVTAASSVEHARDAGFACPHCFGLPSAPRPAH